MDLALTLQFLTSENQMPHPDARPTRLVRLAAGTPALLPGFCRVFPEYHGQDPDVFTDSHRFVNGTRVNERTYDATSVLPDEYWVDRLALAALMDGGSSLTDGDVIWTDLGATLVVDVAADGRATFGFDSVTEAMVGIPSGFDRRDKSQRLIECSRWAIESRTADPAPLIRAGTIPDRRPGSLQLVFSQFGADQAARQVEIRTDESMGYVPLGLSYPDGRIRLMSAKLRS